MNSTNLNVRVYLLSDPKGKTLAYANIAIDNIAAVKNIRVVDGQKGLFVVMPQSQDKTGVYHDIAFPLNKELRELITNSVLAEFEKQSKLPPDERGYEKTENGPGRSIDVSLGTKIFPLKKPKEDVLAFANVVFNDAFVIRGIQIKQTEKGKSVVMPQTEDKEGNLRDVAYPLSGDLRIKISKKVLEAYWEQLETQKPSIENRLAEGIERVAQLAQAPRPQPSMAKSSPGLGD